MNGTYLTRNVGWGSVFLHNPPCVAQQHNAFLNECLAAHLVGYGTNSVPNPPYIDSETA